MRAKLVREILNESDYPITFGKYSGKKYYELPDEYKYWLNNQPGFAMKHEIYKRNLERAGKVNADEDWTFRTGKYKGELFSKISKIDPEYKEFVLKHGIEKFKDFGDDGLTKPIVGDFKLATGKYAGKLLSQTPIDYQDWVSKKGGKKVFGEVDRSINRGSKYFMQE